MKQDTVPSLQGPSVNKEKRQTRETRPKRGGHSGIKGSWRCLEVPFTGIWEGISMNEGKPEGKLVEQQEGSRRVKEGLSPLSSRSDWLTPQAESARRALPPKEQVSPCPEDQFQREAVLCSSPWGLLFFS